MRIAWIGLLAASIAPAADVLILADEFPPMQCLAGVLKTRAATTSLLVKPSEMPAQLGGYRAVVVYIHGVLDEPVERGLIGYAKSGGRLVLLHHSINSSRRKNRYWLDFLGLRLPLGDLAQGGYSYAETPALQLVNLAPNDYITSHEVRYDETISYRTGNYAGFTLRDTEVYLNHTFTPGSKKKVLLGVKYQDPKSGITYMQDHAGWYEKTAKGWVVYFMSGHGTRDFENDAFSQIVVNAVTTPLK